MLACVVLFALNFIGLCVAGKYFPIVFLLAPPLFVATAGALVFSQWKDKDEIPGCLGCFGFLVFVLAVVLGVLLAFFPGDLFGWLGLTRR